MALGLGVAGGLPTPALATSPPSIEFVNGAMTVANAPAATDKVKWYAGSPLAYLGQATSQPWSWPAPTSGIVQARVMAGKTELARLDAQVSSGVPTPTQTPTPTVSATPTPTPTATPTVPSSGTVNVSTVTELIVAFRDAVPGRTINVAPGDYVTDNSCTVPGGAAAAHLCGSAVGTEQAPVTVNAAGARLVGHGPTSRYGLYLYGASYWHITGLAVTEASKGIVLDLSTHVTLDSVDVGRVGDEGVHFRHCSADGVLRRSHVHDTGLAKPQYGEGVYVGSANSNWGPYACVDGRDNSERVLVENSLFENIPAEGADLKEGTDSGTLRGNTFINAGFSGANSADSAVDAKGNGWVVELNTVRGCSGACVDAFQTHSVYTGYGTRNTFRANVVEGALPGFGFGLNPVAANVVRCDNSAGGAALGLVGTNGTAIPCSP